MCIITIMSIIVLMRAHLGVGKNMTFWWNWNNDVNLNEILGIGTAICSDVYDYFRSCENANGTGGKEKPNYRADWQVQKSWRKALKWWRSHSCAKFVVALSFMVSEYSIRITFCRCQRWYYLEVILCVRTTTNYFLTGQGEFSASKRFAWRFWNIASFQYTVERILQSATIKCT